MIVDNLFYFIYILFGNNYNMFYTDKPLTVCIFTSIYVDVDLKLLLTETTNDCRQLILLYLLFSWQQLQYVLH